MKQARNTRKSRASQGEELIIKDKFLQERAANLKPINPMTAKQRVYMDLINTKPVVVATGYAGTAKTYLPTAMAADLLRTGKIKKIIVTRPAVSSSKSVGYFKGSEIEKMSVWLNSVIPIFNERLGPAAFEIALANKSIEFIPLEVIKGMSINDAWVLSEESSDLTKEEVTKLVTRMGRNSKLILSGDIRQSELAGESGLLWISDFVKRHNLSKNFGFVDFNDINDIVRSDSVREFIVALVRDEKKGIK